MLPFKAVVPTAFVALLISGLVIGNPESGSHIIAGVAYLLLGCTVVLVVGAGAAAILTPDRRLMWSALGFALGALLLVAFLWGGSFLTPTKVP